MNQLLKYVIGIDISKDLFDACLMSVDQELNYKIKATHNFSNSLTGFKQLKDWLKKHCKEKVNVQILMEASGVYHEKLAIWLTDHDYTVNVVLANKARKYMQALGLKSKNDKIDARGLALMCAQHKFDVWQPISKYFYELRLLTRYNQNLQQLRTGFKNQLHALEYSGYQSKDVKRQLVKMIDNFEKQIKENKKHIQQHINSNVDVKRKVAQINLIKGVDLLSIATLLAETNGFELFKNANQLVSYAGYDVIENQSGQHIGKTRISKKGNSRIRRILHMPAFNVVRYNKGEFLNLYSRIYERTHMKMKAYVAVQKKLLILIYALWKKDEAYQFKYQPDKTSGNDEPRSLFRFSETDKTDSDLKKIVLPYSNTTQDALRYNELPEVLFRSNKNKKKVEIN